MGQSLDFARWKAKQKKTVAEEMSHEFMTEALRAFDAYLRNGQLKQYRIRRWQPGKSFSNVSFDDLEMDAHEFMLASSVALEIEGPFLDQTRGYPWESAMSFEKILPALSRYVGKVDAEQVTALVQGESVRCDRNWCMEEFRHPNLWLQLINRMTGIEHKFSDFTINDNDSLDFTEQGGIMHLSNRVASEVGASSSYLTIASKLKGSTGAFIREMYRDELKHLAIFGSASQYINGYRPWKRRLELLRDNLDFS